MKIIKLLALAIFAFAGSSVFAATFELENKSDDNIRVFVMYDKSLPSYIPILMGQSRLYDTGIHSVKKIYWSGKNKSGREGIFILELPTGVLLPAVRLNYNFNIFPNGHYSSNFAGGHFVYGEAKQFVEKK